MEVKVFKLSEVTPYENNPRNNDDAVEALKMSLNSFGYQVPLVVDKAGVILAGHTRFEALRQMGVKEFQCVVVDLPPEKAKAFRLADNRTHEMSGWDKEKLTSELREIMDLEAMKVYFPDRDLDALVRDVVSAPGLPTNESVSRAAQTLNTKFERRSDAKQRAYRDITCPCCRETFSVDVEEIKRRYARRALQEIPDGAPEALVC